MSIAKDNIAILLLAFGGPESLEEVKPFLQSVLAPRPVSNELVENAKNRYSQIGGKSPLLEITKKQAAALESALEHNLKVYVGMKHWHPFIKETLARMTKDGVKEAVAVILAPHNTKASTGGYKKAVEEAVVGTGFIPVRFIQGWHTNPLFLQALANRIKDSLNQFSKPDNVFVIFSAHSLPQRLVENDAYEDQLKETIEGVLKITGPLKYKLAYQSKGGGPGEWLGPGVIEVMEELAASGQKDVLIVPFGFVADHVETLYDIDIVFKEKADNLGMNFKRTPSLNDSPDFIQMLAVIIDKYVGRVPRTRRKENK